MMSNALPRAVTDAADVSAITQLILRERSGRDLNLWEQMLDCYHPDSRVRLSWIDDTGPEFVRRSREMAERNTRATHRLAPVMVTLAGERAIAAVGGIIDIPLRIQDTAALLSSHARFMFRAERRAGTWRLAGFDVVYQRDELRCAVPGQSVTIDPLALQRHRPSYALLTYCLDLQGFPIRDDLAGDDRPELVTALMQELYGWAGVPVPK